MLVRVPDIDVDLYLENVAQLDEASRWLWIVLGDAGQDLPLSADGAARIEDLLQIYGTPRREISAQADAAQMAGRSKFTLEIDLPVEASADIDQLLELMDRVSRLVGEQGLAMPASPKLTAFRQRLLGEVVRQLRAGPDA